MEVAGIFRSAFRFAVPFVPLALVIAAGFYLSQSSTPNQQVMWGPVQTAKVNYVYSINSSLATLVVTETSGDGLWIDVSPPNCYSVGDTIYYRASTYDPAILTQRLALVNAPPGCHAVSPTV